MKTRINRRDAKARRTKLPELSSTVSSSASPRLCGFPFRPGIEQDTELMPWVIADSVIAEASRFLNKPIPPAWADWLDERAERIYARNAHFRRLIRRKDETGRNYLRRFFRHWLAGRMKRERFPGWHLLPKEFCFGAALSIV